MSATVLRFDGRVTRKPGAYVKVDASALDSPPAGATGRVLLIGNVDGGAPYSEVTAKTVARFTSSPALKAAFRGGDLKEAGALTFKPALDEDITGAQEVICLKVNPDTGSALTLANGSGDSIDLESRDFGPHTNQISIEVANGTTVAGSKKVSVHFESVTEIFDNIGGTALFTLQYREVSGIGWDTMTAQQIAAGVKAVGTRTEASKDTELANPALNEAVRVVSTSAADTTQTVTVYGLVGGVPTARQIALNGTTQVLDTVAFDAGGIFGAALSAVTVGDVTVSHVTGPTNVFVFTAGDLDRGGVRAQAMFVQGALTMVADGASATSVFFAGRDTSGATVLEVKALNGTTPVVTTTTTWKQIDFIGLAKVTTGRNITFSATAAQSDHTVQDTLLKLRDFFNSLQVVVSSTTYGFIATLGTTRSEFDPADLDLMSAAVTCYYSGSYGFLANLALMVEALNDNSVYVTAEAATNAIGAPSNTSTPLYLSGGTLGVASNNDWQAALDLARFIQCDTVVVLTASPAVHAMLGEHLDFMAGPGRGERDGIVGIMNAGLTGLANLTEIQSQIVALNNRNLGVCVEEFDRFDTNGELRTFAPYFYAALLAGAQAGTALGRSLTGATLNVRDVRGHSSWNILDNIETLLESGAMVTEEVPNVGFQLVRDVTSNVGSDNPVYTDRAANRIVNYCTREIRTDLDTFKGEPGYSGSRTAIEGRVRRKLNNFVNVENILREWKDLVISIEVDRAPVAVSLAPVFSINFVPITLSLYDAPVTG